MTDMLTDEAVEEPQAVLNWLDESPTLSRAIAACRRLDRIAAARPGVFERRALFIARNFTIEPVEALARTAAYRVGLQLDITYSGYDAMAEAATSGLGGGADAVIIALRLEEIAPALTRDFLGTPPEQRRDLADDVIAGVTRLARQAADATSRPVFVHNFVTPAWAASGLADSQDPTGQVNLLRRINLDLVEAVGRIPGAHVIDLDLLFSRASLSQCYDSRGDRASNAPLSHEGLRVLGGAWVRHLRAVNGPAVKCIVTDCDNTLWKGVIGEDGLTGISVNGSAGLRHRDLQQDLLDLRRRGIVLAICSKNEETDVLEALRLHPDFLLREDDFAAMRINWDPKADNLVSLAEELNLGLQHFIFIDDDATECDWVAARLPEVRVVQWPQALEPHGRLDDLGLFDGLALTKEDRSRSDMYRAEASRRRARAGDMTESDYLASLQLTATVGLAQPEHVMRLAQLTQRTNQFNLTTHRYDAQTLEQLASDVAWRVVWLDLQDRFGSYGIVGCAILELTDEQASIDTLLLSCRVLGRKVETVLINKLANLAAAAGAKVLLGQYVPSKRNSQVADLFGRLGFEGPIALGERLLWRWSIAAGAPQVPDWISVVEAEEKHQ